MTKMMSAAALAVALVAAAAASPAAQQAELALAMIRPDGILTPFAVFDGRTWTAAWPEPQDKMVLDRMIEAMPSYWRERRQTVPAAWHLPALDGRPARTARVLERVVFQQYCGFQVGLLTDAQREAPGEWSPRWLALSQPVNAERPVDLSANTAARTVWKPLIDRIDAAVLQQEEAAAGDWSRHVSRDPGLPEASARAPLRLRTLQAFQRGSDRVLYYEAVREYRKPARGDQRPSIVIASGWIRATGARTEPGIPERAWLTSKDIQDGGAKPLGIVDAGGRIFWIARVIGYEGESFRITEIMPGVMTVLTQSGGGC